MVDGEWWMVNCSEFEVERREDASVLIHYPPSTYPPFTYPLNQPIQRIQQQLLVEITFGEIGICASLETAIAIGCLREGGYQYYGEILIVSMVADLGGEFQSAPAGHFYVRNDEIELPSLEFFPALQATVTW
jgi:hypothetical protein